MRMVLVVAAVALAGEQEEDRMVQAVNVKHRQDFWAVDQVEPKPEGICACRRVW